MSGNERTMAATAAVRINEEAGTREEMEFIGSGPEKMFSVLHAPLGEPRGAVLICSSFLAELIADYTEEVLLARRLCERGIMVRRFHFRGTGHSDGDAERVTLDSMCADAAEVAERLRSDVSHAPIGFVGTRVGGMTASFVARSYPGAPVALCEPALAGDKLLREIVRNRLVQQMKEGQKRDSRTTEQIFAAVESDGLVDLLGYPLTKVFCDSIRDRRLADELGTDVRPTLLVHFSRRTSLPPDLQRFIDDVVARGFTPKVEQIEDEIAWWLHDVRRHFITKHAEVVGDWLEAQFA